MKANSLEVEKQCKMQYPSKNRGFCFSHTKAAVFISPPDLVLSSFKLEILGFFGIFALFLLFYIW